MPMLSLLNESALTKSTDQNSANLINLYMVSAQDQDKYQTEAYYTPGCTLFSVGTTTSRSVWSQHGIIYLIDGNNFCSINSSGTRTTLGTLNTSSGWAKIRGIANQLFIVDSTNGYYYTITTNTFAVITDSVFTTTILANGIQDIECQDEFGLVLLKNSQEWFASAISDLSTWPVLSFASTTGNQNYNVGIVSCHRELYLLGTQTSEVWDNLGTVNFTFGRNQSVFIEYGLAAVASIAKGNNTFFFLAQSPTGGYVVMQMQGYSPVIVSNAGINYQISTYSVVSDAIGIIYQQEGHEFYVITFPTAGVTWAYDMSLGTWAQRQSLVGGVQTRWLAECYTFNYNKQLIGDVNTGNIYQLDMTNFTENGTAITRTMVSHPFYNSGANIFADKLQIDFDNTPGANLANWTLYISRDGGRTFDNGRAAYPTQDAHGMWRVYWNRLGYAKCFVFKLVTNANMLSIILGAWANFRTADVS